MRLSALLLLGLCSALFATPQGPVVQISTTRAEIVLNGAWRFEPAADGKKQPTDDWGNIQVPGSWFPKKGSVPGILESGKSAVWKTINETTSAAWYERSIEIPADWAGREIEVNFERVSTEAIVFLDGKEAGKLEWPGGTVNLTRTAKPGRQQTLRLYVVATPDAVDLDYMGIGQNTARKATLETRGITGDVVLSCRPGGTWIGGIFIQPSVRGKNLKLTVEWSGKTPTAPVACEVIAKRWPGGEEAKRWTVELPAGAVSSVDCPWEDPQLWDYKQPNLYTLSVTTPADSVSERFGFREWRIDGRTLLLNEIPFRPQPVNLSSGWMSPPGFGNHRAVGALLDLQLNRGIGLGWEWPEKFFQRGNPTWFGQDLVTHDGIDALQSAPIPDAVGFNDTEIPSESVTRLNVEGPGVLQFHYRVDSESGRDFFITRSDGIEFLRKSGFVEWRQHTLELQPGSHVLEFVYSKDGAGASGADAAWIDEVAFIPGPVPPPLQIEAIIINPSNPRERIIQFHSRRGRIYTAQSSPDLVEWQDFGGVVIGNGQLKSFTHTLPMRIPPAWFYRVGETLPENTP